MWSQLSVLDNDQCDFILCSAVSWLQVRCDLSLQSAAFPWTGEGVLVSVVQHLIGQSEG